MIYYALLKTSSRLSLLTSLFWDCFYHSVLLGTFQQLFSSLLSGQPMAKRWGFFLRRSICKIGVLASQLTEVRQAGGTTNLCSGFWAQVPAQPSSLITLPLTRWNRGVMPTAGYLSALHSTHTGGNGGAAFHVATESGLWQVVDVKHHNALCYWM